MALHVGTDNPVAVIPSNLAPTSPRKDHAPAGKVGGASERMVNIQALRAVAAWGVVGHHLVNALHNYIAIGRFPYDPAIGSYGVEIFFVISGFVMMTSTSGRSMSPGHFLALRWVRVAPLYWALTLAVALAMVSGVRLYASHDFDPARLATSLAFLPSWVDGAIGNPLLFPGWTLNYEMMFYVVFAVALLFRSVVERAAFVLAVLCEAIVAQWTLNDPLVDYLGRDIVLGFGGGIVLWFVHRRGVIPFGAAWPLIGLGVAAMIVLDLTDWGKSLHGEIPVTIAAVMIVAGALVLERGGVAAHEGLAVAQGDASYSLYLIHPFVLQIVGKLFQTLHLNQGWLGVIVALIVMIASAGAAGWLVHRWFEVPVTRWLKRALIG